MVSTALALREESTVAKPAVLLSRAEVLTRYHHFREISKQHHSAALDFLSKDAIISQARRLGLALRADQQDLLAGAMRPGHRPLSPRPPWAHAGTLLGQRAARRAP